MNQLGEASERDRLNVGFFTRDPLSVLIQDESLRVRYSDLKLVAGFRQKQLTYIRRDTPPGIDAAFSADYEKVVRTKPRFIIGAQGEAIISGLGKVQPAFVSFLRRYIDTRR